MGKIKKSGKENKGNLIKVPETKIPEIDYPIFCFRYLHRDYHVDSCIEVEKGAFISRLVKLSQLSWAEIAKLDRHGYGWEKINVDSIKPQLPASYVITDEVKHLFAFRYHDLKPFLGIRNRALFHVFYIDYKRNIYDHGE